MELRTRQLEAMDAVVREYKTGIRRQLIVMATGTGKTVVFSHLFEKLFRELTEELPGRMLVLAHREELVDQALRTMQRVNPNVKVGKEMAECRADLDCKIVVSCVASIGREGSKRLERLGLNTFDKVICDEAHHSIASTYMNVFEALGLLLPNTKKLLVGFTATPKRKNIKRTKKYTTLDSDDLMSLKSVYEKIVFSYPIRTAIKEGWLVPIRGIKVKTDVSLDNIKVVAGDFKQDELAVTVNNPERNLQAVKAWKDHAEGRQTVGFTVDIAHANDLAKTFRQYGLNAEAVWGNDPLRAEKLLRHKRKEITTLFNAQVLTEGYDDWRVACILLAAPTASSTKFTQMVGRGTRLQDGTGNLLEAIQASVPLEKRDCLVIDMVDCSKKCSLVTFPSLFGLNPEMDLQGQSVTAAVETLEELQDKYPGVDFTTLTNLKDVKQFVESIDIFAEPFTQEVKEFSQLSWMATQDGSYVLSIPEKEELRKAKAFSRFLHEKLHIKENELDEFELSITTVNDERKLGIFATLKEAFEIADDVIKRCRSERMKLIAREASWHSSPASEPAKKYLRRLSKQRTILWCLCENAVGTPKDICPSCHLRMGLTAGQASLALNILQTK